MPVAALVVDVFVVVVETRGAASTHRNPDLRAARPLFSATARTPVAAEARRVLAAVNIDVILPSFNERSDPIDRETARARAREREMRNVASSVCLSAVLQFRVALPSLATDIYIYR